MGLQLPQSAIAAQPAVISAGQLNVSAQDLGLHDLKKVPSNSNDSLI